MRAGFIKGRKPLSGQPITVDGVKFLPYKAGSLQYERISEDGKLLVRERSHWGTTYQAVVDGLGPIRSKSGRPTAFRTQRAAMAAAVKAAKGIKP